MAEAFESDHRPIVQSPFAVQITQNKMYHVVNFVEDDDALSIIPSNWLNGDHTAWPPYRGTRLRKAVKDCEEPSAGWALHPCRVMGSSSTYEDAKLKEKKAEETSDLATEEEQSQKRKRKPPRHILSSSEDEQESEPVAEHGHGKPQASISTFIPAPAPPKVPAPRNQQPPPSSSADIPGAKRKRTGFQAEVLRLLGGIAAQLQSQAKILRQLEAQRHEPKKPNSIPAVLHLLPLSSHEDVAQLETLLQEDENKEALIAHLALIGGSSVQDVTRTVMKRCMLDALAKNYCMTGRKGKLRMEHLQLVGVVTGAVHRCFEQKKKNGEEAVVVQENTTLKAIADWLRYAAARVKKMEGTASA